MTETANAQTRPAPALELVRPPPSGRRAGLASMSRSPARASPIAGLAPRRAEPRICLRRVGSGCGAETSDGAARDPRPPRSERRRCVCEPRRAPKSKRSSALMTVRRTNAAARVRQGELVEDASPGYGALVAALDALERQQRCRGSAQVAAYAKLARRQSPPAGSLGCSDRTSISAEMRTRWRIRPGSYDT